MSAPGRRRNPSRAGTRASALDRSGRRARQVPPAAFRMRSSSERAAALAGRGARVTGGAAAAARCVAWLACTVTGAGGQEPVIEMTAGTMVAGATSAGAAIDPPRAVGAGATAAAAGSFGGNGWASAGAPAAAVWSPERAAAEDLDVRTWPSARPPTMAAKRLAPAAMNAQLLPVPGVRPAPEDGVVGGSDPWRGGGRGTGRATGGWEAAFARRAVGGDGGEGGGGREEVVRAGPGGGDDRGCARGGGTVAMAGGTVTRDVLIGSGALAPSFGMADASFARSLSSRRISSRVDITAAPLASSRMLTHSPHSARHTRVSPAFRSHRVCRQG